MELSGVGESSDGSTIEEADPASFPLFGGAFGNKEWRVFAGKGSEDGRCWGFSVVYASCHASVRVEQWGSLRRLLQDWQYPWIMIGDFNEIAHSSENFPFTWNNQRCGEANIRQRLDRALVSSDWRLLFPRASLSHCSVAGSDHVALLLDFQPIFSFKARQFYFDARWVSHVDCHAIIEAAWKSRFHGSPFILLGG
ncbi:uncharacterized protein LOC132270149 [Cornus florida]|uniref:uncharacterized protein LOC132270149 n=1 Tax=Cornus florida TaxID=4283 RepID=UPI00289E332F|nr:uncharacterized protein LOC132270149 [Cornus florida]